MIKPLLQGCAIGVSSFTFVWMRSAPGISINVSRYLEYAFFYGVIPEIFRRIAHQHLRLPLQKIGLRPIDVKYFPSGNALYAGSRLAQAISYHQNPSYSDQPDNLLNDQLIASAIFNLVILGLEASQLKGKEADIGTGVCLLGGLTLGAAHGWAMSRSWVQSHPFERYFLPSSKTIPAE